MKPTDFPIERLAELENTFIGMADAQRQRARVNAVQPDGDPIVPHPSDPVAIPGTPDGFYESALAYYEAARAVKIASDEMIRTLARIGAAEDALVEQEKHPWPLPHLVNLTEACPDSQAVPMPGGYSERFPKWGLANEQPFGPDVETVTVFPAAQVAGGFFLRIAQGPDLDSPAVQSCASRIDYDQWDALVALVARMRAGKPIPYDEAGNFRGPQPQEPAR